MGLFGGKKKEEQDPRCVEMANWLAHPNEFGVMPRKSWIIRIFKKNIIPNPEPVEIALIGYEMPDGRKGRGFVGYLTWSFMGDGVESIPDESIVLAYTGWAFLFPGLQEGKIITDFDETDQERSFRSEMSKVKEFEIVEKTRIGELELFDYRGFALGKRIRGCGSVESNLYYTEDMPEFNLPAFYFMLGNEQNG